MQQRLHRWRLARLHGLRRARVDCEGDESMTREEALDILARAPHNPRPCVIEPAFTQTQAIGIITRAVNEYAPGETLDTIMERRVWQVSRNQRYPIIKPDPEATA
jgi:hypothetical protein